MRKVFKSSNLGFQILRTSYLVGSITLAFKFLFVTRDLIIAWTFGRSQSLEAFILAFLIPYTFINALAESLSITFLPHFIELRESEKFNLANEIYSNLLGILLLISFIIVFFLIVGYSIYSPFVAASFSIERFSLMKFLMFFTALAALFNGVAILWKEILNAKGKFLQSASVSVISPIISIILLVWMTELGVWVLSLGLLFGVLLELIILGVLLKKESFRLLPRLSVFSLNLRISISDWWRVFISLTLFNSMGLINGFMAARRAEIGGLAILSYGKKIATLPNDISAITFSSVLITYLSKIKAEKDWNRVLAILNKWLLIIFATTLPIVITVFFMANNIVEILYERGAFNVDDTKSVSIVLRYYIFQIPFFVSFYVMLRILPIIKKNTPAVYFGALGVALTVILNYVFIRFLGTSGIALATSCVYFCLSICFYFYIRRELKLKAKAEELLLES